MEPTTLFAAFIVFMGGCNLVFSAIDHLGDGVYSEEYQPVQQDDWYCFFHTSDLLGVKGAQKGNARRQQQQREQQRRQQQQRPRVQA